MRILLIRHGPSAAANVRGFLDREGVERWRLTYDAAGIASNVMPPPAVVATVAQADVIVASDLPRAFATAALMCSGKPVVSSALFREIPLRIPRIPLLRAPLIVWDALIHLSWWFDILTGR